MLLALVTGGLIYPACSQAQGLADPSLRSFKLGQSCAQAVEIARALNENGDGLKGNHAKACELIPNTLGSFQSVTLQRFVPEELKDVLIVSMDETNKVQEVLSQKYWFQPPGAPELPTPTQMREQLAQKYGAPDVQATWQTSDGVVFAYLFGQPQLRGEGTLKWLGQEAFEAAIRRAQNSYLHAEIEAFKNSHNVRGVSQVLKLRKIPVVPRDVKL